MDRRSNKKGQIGLGGHSLSSNGGLSETRCS